MYKAKQSFIYQNVRPFFQAKRAGLWGGVILSSPFMLVVMLRGQTKNFYFYDLNILLKDEYFWKKSKPVDFDRLTGFNVYFFPSVFKLQMK